MISKEKKKKVFTEIESDISAKIGYSNTFPPRIPTSTSPLRHPISFGGCCFQFFTKIRPKKQQKRAILHTSQANGAILHTLQAPPPLATLLPTGSIRKLTSLRQFWFLRKRYDAYFAWGQAVYNRRVAQ